MNIFLRRSGLGLESIRNIKAKMTKEAQIFRIDLGYRLPRYDYAINWGNYDYSPYVLHDVINTPDAIREVSNKSAFRKKLYDNGLTMETFLTKREAMDFVSSTGKSLIIRPRNHLGGNNLVKTDDSYGVVNAFLRFGSGTYASAYVPKVKEYRVFVAQGRVVYIVDKIVNDTSSIAWNVHQGGRFENVRFGSWNIDVANIAVKAFNLTALDFGAVDVIVDNEGKCYVLEINTAPALTSEYWSTCIAKVLDYIVERGVGRIEVSPEASRWRDLVHPAINNEAIIPRDDLDAAMETPYTLADMLRRIERDYDLEDGELDHYMEGLE